MNTKYRINHKWNGVVISYGIFQRLIDAQESLKQLNKRKEMNNSEMEYELITIIY